MPSGRPGAIARPVWSKGLPYSVNVRSMRLAKYSKPRKDALTTAELRQCRKALRDAFQIYLIDCGRFNYTSTELRKGLLEVAKAAKKFISSEDWSYANALLSQIESNENIEAIIRRGLNIDGKSWLAFKRGLRDVVAVSSSVDSLRPIVGRLSQMNVNELAPKGAKWRDPALTRLVVSVALIWTTVTLRTARRFSMKESEERGYEEQHFFFADWLHEMQDILNVPRSPEGRILDILSR